MPNWVTNRVIVIGSSADVKSLVDFVKSDDCSFDFNNIVPMPKSLDIGCDSFNDDAIAYYLTDRLTKTASQCRLSKYIHNHFDKKWHLTVCKRIRDSIISGNRDDAALDSLYTLGSVLISNKKKYGCYTWYDWRCKNWGTKWNAHESQSEYCDGDDEARFYFDTAWSGVSEVISVLARKFPSLTLKYMYVEEQGPLYTGSFKFENGQCVDNYEPESESDDAYAIMFELWGNEDDYVKVPGEGYVSYYEHEEEYDTFYRQWKVDHSGPEFEGMCPPCFAEWYRNDRLLNHVEEDA